MKRILFVDVAKILCAFLVVFAHLFTEDWYLRIYIYAFHMPLFFLTSGLFHKQMSLLNALEKYFYSIIIPFFFFLILGIIYQTFDNWIGSDYPIHGVLLYVLKKTINSIIFSKTIYANGVLWFLLALFWVKMFSILSSGYKNTWLIFIPLALLWYIESFFNINLFYTKNAIMVFPFYFLSYKYNYTIISLVEKRWFKFSFIFLFLLSFLLTFVNGRVSTKALWFGVLPYHANVFVFYLNALIASLGVFSLSSIISKRSAIINILSSSLMSIFALQLIIYSPIVSIIQVNNSCIIAFGITIIVFIISCIFDRVLTDICPILLGKYKKQ